MPSVLQAVAVAILLTCIVNTFSSPLVVQGQKISRVSAVLFGSHTEFLYMRVGLPGMMSGDLVNSTKGWPGYNVATGKASEKGAVVLPAPIMMGQSDSVSRLSVVQSSSSLITTEMTRVSVGGSFLGLDFGATTEQQRVVATESTRASVSIFYQANVISKILPMGETVKLSDEANTMIKNEQWKQFVDSYGTHVVTSLNYGCFTAYSFNFKFGKYGAAKKFREELGKLSIMHEPSRELLKKIKALALACDPKASLNRTIDGNFKDDLDISLNEDNLFDMKNFEKHSFNAVSYSDRCRAWVTGSSESSKFRDEALFSVYARSWGNVYPALSNKIPSLSHVQFQNIQEGVIQRNNALDTYEFLENYSSLSVASSGKPWNAGLAGYTGCYEMDDQDNTVPVPILGPLNKELNSTILKRVKFLKEAQWLDKSASTEKIQNFTSTMILEATKQAPLLANQAWPFYTLLIESDTKDNPYQAFRLSYNLFEEPESVCYPANTRKAENCSSIAKNTPYIEISPYVYNEANSDPKASRAEKGSPFQYFLHNAKGEVVDSGYLQPPFLAERGTRWTQLKMPSNNDPKVSSPAIKTALIPDFSQENTEFFPIYANVCN
eukprot:Nk52_evm11s217 gene=Nk52_evmTU11s217